MSGQTSFSYLDDYCERAGEAGLWAEPVNAVTNIAFLIAAFLALRHLRRQAPLGWRHLDLAALVLVLAAIGIGSGLWHSYATPETMLADVLPITLFINLYLVSFLRRILKLGWACVLGFWLIFLGATILSEAFLPRDTLNGSVMYLPAFLTLILLAVSARLKKLPSAKDVWAATLLFAVSVTFRTLDLALCPSLPLGTHFLWHLLNAAVLYRLLRVLIGSPASSGGDNR